MLYAIPGNITHSLFDNKTMSIFFTKNHRLAISASALFFLEIFFPSKVYALTLPAVHTYVFNGTSTNNQPCYDYQIGTFTAKNGFIASSNYKNWICSNELAEIANKPVMKLSYFAAYASTKLLGGIKRASKTYSIDGIQHVVLYSAKFPLNPKPVIKVSEFGYGDSGEIKENSADDYGYYMIQSDIFNNSDISVSYSLSGSAKKLQDYKVFYYDDSTEKRTEITNTKNITLRANTNFQLLYIVPVDDSKIEKRESIKLTLKANTKLYKLGKPNTATININDNE